MSSGGGGGFYKYPCKYYYTKDCPHWVYVNNSPCAECCAMGRDAEESEEMGVLNLPRDTFMPVGHGRMLYGTSMESVNTGEPDSDCGFQEAVSQQPEAELIMTTSVMPGLVMPSREH